MSSFFHPLVEGFLKIDLRKIESACNRNQIANGNFTSVNLKLA